MGAQGRGGTTLSRRDALSGKHGEGPQRAGAAPAQRSRGGEPTRNEPPPIAVGHAEGAGVHRSSSRRRHPRATHRPRHGRQRVASGSVISRGDGDAGAPIRDSPPSRPGGRVVETQQPADQRGRASNRVCASEPFGLACPARPWRLTHLHPRARCQVSDTIDVAVRAAAAVSGRHSALEYRSPAECERAEHRWQEFGDGPVCPAHPRMLCATPVLSERLATFSA